MFPRPAAEPIKRADTCCGHRLAGVLTPSPSAVTPAPTSLVRHTTHSHSQTLCTYTAPRAAAGAAARAISLFFVYLSSLQRPIHAAVIIGPILWGHSDPLCHALSLLSSSLLWTSIAIAIGRRRATVATPGEWQCKTAARSGEWAQQFSNASC